MDKVTQANKTTTNEVEKIESFSATPDVKINVEQADEKDVKPEIGSPVSSQDSGVGEEQMGTDEEEEFDLGTYFGTKITLNMGRPPRPDEIALDDEVTQMIKNPESMIICHPFLTLSQTSLLKTLWEKDKLLARSNFSFFNSFLPV